MNEPTLTAFGNERAHVYSITRALSLSPTRGLSPHRFLSARMQPSTSQCATPRLPLSTRRELMTSVDQADKLDRLLQHLGHITSTQHRAPPQPGTTRCFLLRRTKYSTITPRRATTPPAAAHMMITVDDPSGEAELHVEESIPAIKCGTSGPAFSQLPAWRPTVSQPPSLVISS